MADVQSNIKVSIDTTSALTSIKNLQRQISAFHTSMAKGGAAANVVNAQMQQTLINSINATGKFSAQMKTIRTTTESFTNSLEKNKFSLGEYFKYAGGASRSFGKLFKTEFDTINKVARENVKDLQTQYIKLGRDANGAMRSIAVRPLSLDMNDLATKTMIASEKQALLNQLLKQGSTNLLNFGKNTQWAGRQLMVGFTIPLITVGSAAAKTFMDMETQAIRFKKVYGDLFTPQAETDAALAGIKELGKSFTQYGVAVSDTVGLAAEAAAAGFKGVDLQRQTTAATRLSILGQIDNQKALETTISVQNAFAVSSEELASSIDFLNAVENQTVVSLDDITTAIPKVAPVIKQLGGDVKDLAFFMTAMKEGGINASEGANALKSGLASMINPTGKAVSMLESFGINIKKIVVDNKGDLKKTVVEFATALNQLDPLNRAQAIEQMFGKFQFARLSTLFANVTKEGTQAARVLDLAGSSVQDLAALSEKELGMTADSAMNKFKKSVEDLKLTLVPVGEEFLKAATPIIAFVGRILEGFNNLGDGTKRVIVTVTAIVAGLGPVLLMTFGLLMNGVANVIKAFTFMKSLFNTTGKSSATLGTEVRYMTTEQRNAAAVAASLDQVHNNLAQTFSSEASAVDRLTAAYRRAIAAQSAFMPTGIPMGRGPVTKRAKGKPAVVGGTGNKDSELSLLMPGETVIPTDMSKKYGGLINGMIDDSIPGYEGGKKSISDLKKSYSLYAAPDAVSAQTVKMTWGTLKDELAAVDKVAEEFNATLTEENKLGTEQIANMKRVTAAHKEQDTVDVPMGEGKSMSVKAWRASNLMPEIGPNTFLNSLVTKKEGLAAFEDQGMAKAAENLGMSMTDVSKELELLKKGIQPTTKQGASVLKEVAGFYKNERPITTRTGKPKKESRKERGIRFQAAATEAVLKTRLADNSSGQYYNTMVNGKYDASKDAKAAEQVYNQARKVRMAFLKETEAMADKAMSAIKKRLGIKSPSTELVKVGKQMADGMAIGIKNGTADVVAASKNLGTSAVNATDRVVKEKNRRVSTRAQGPVPIGPAMPAGATQLGIVSKPQQTRTQMLMSGAKAMPRRMSSMGGGMGLLGANMGLSMLPDFAGKGAAQGALAGANLGMMFGPKGMAAGAAIGLVTSAYTALIAKQKEHAAITKSVFTSNSAEIELFGGKVIDTTLKINALGFGIKGITTIFGSLTPEVQAFVNAINALPDDDPTKMFVKGLKELDSTSAVTGNIRSKVSEMIALGGLPVEDAQKVIAAMLDAAGMSSKFGEVWAGVQKSVSSETAATTTMLNKLNDALGASNDEIVGNSKSWYEYDSFSKPVIKTYEKMNTEQRMVADSLKKFTGALTNGTLTADQFNARLNGIKNSAFNGVVGLGALRAAILESGDADALAGFDSINFQLDQIGAKSVDSMIKLMALKNANITAEGAAQMLGKKYTGSNLPSHIKEKTDASLLLEASSSEAWKKQMDQMAKDRAKLLAALSGTNTYKDPNTDSKGAGKTPAEKYLEVLQKQIDALEAKRDAQKELNDQIQKEIDLQEKMQDLESQAVNAKISGNYIQAAALGQQSKNLQAQYARDLAIDKMDDPINALMARKKAIEDGAKLTKSEISQIPKKANGGLIKGPGTGRSDSIRATLGYAGGGSIRVSNGEFVVKASSVRDYGVGAMNAVNNGTANIDTNSGGTVYNINMPITSNAASPEGVANEVMRRLKVEINKNNKSNRVNI